MYRILRKRKVPPESHTMRPFRVRPSPREPPTAGSPRPPSPCRAWLQAERTARTLSFCSPVLSFANVARYHLAWCHEPHVISWRQKSILEKLLYFPRGKI